MKIVDNVKVYGLLESIKAAKYPKSVNIAELDEKLTDGIKNLAKAAPGTGHNNWLSGVTVQFDLTCTNKMWVEFERYHFAQIVSSQSTMHRISRLNIDKQCCPYVDERIIKVCEELQDNYRSASGEDDQREAYLKLLYNIPSGFMLTARISTNYLQLKTMYLQRRTHRLPEWRAFCEWIDTLPMSELITGKKGE